MTNNPFGNYNSNPVWEQFLRDTRIGTVVMKKGRGLMVQHFSNEQMIKATAAEEKPFIGRCQNLHPIAAAFAPELNAQHLLAQLDVAKAEVSMLQATVVILMTHINSAGACETEEQVIEWQNKSAELANGVPGDLVSYFEAQIPHMGNMIAMQANLLGEYKRASHTLITAIANDGDKQPGVKALVALNKTAGH